MFLGMLYSSLQLSGIFILLILRINKTFQLFSRRYLSIEFCNVAEIASNEFLNLNIFESLLKILNIF